MKKLIRSATSVALVTMLALTLLTQPQLTNSAVAVAQDRGQATRPQQGDRGVKVLRGESVKAYVQNLRQKDKALNRALKDMVKWGRLPNWEASAVIREVPKPEKETASLKFLPASVTQDQYWSDGNGNEMIIITAYGSESYWDGTIHTYEASSGESSTYNGAVNDLVANDPETSDVVDEVYYPPDGGPPYREGEGGGGGGCEDPTQIYCFPIYETRIVPDGNTPGPAKITNASSTTTAKRVGFAGWFSRYFRCIKRCTALATQFCFQQNPTNFRNFFVCLAVGGTAASVTCAFNTRACGG